jgi:hypothetical protein
MNTNAASGHNRSDLIASSDSDSSLKDWSRESKRTEQNARTQTAALNAISNSPTTSSDMRQRKPKHSTAAQTSAVAQQHAIRDTLLGHLEKFEESLGCEKNEDASWCDCLSTPSSQGWRLNEKGRAEAYSEPGGFLAETASYQAGVAGKILEVLGNEQRLNRYPLTLRYLLEQESMTPEPNNEDVETLFTLFVKSVAEKHLPEKLDSLVQEQLWASYLNILGLLGKEKVESIFERAKKPSLLATQVQQKDDSREITMGEDPYHGISSENVLKAFVLGMSDAASTSIYQRPQDAVQEQRGMQLPPALVPRPDQTVVINMHALRQLFASKSPHPAMDRVLYETAPFGGRLRQHLVLMDANQAAHQALSEET